jgi:hypothetical protein
LPDWHPLKEQMLVPATGSTIAHLVPFAHGTPRAVKLPPSVCARGQVSRITKPLAVGKYDALLGLWCDTEYSDDDNEESGTTAQLDRRVTVLLDARHGIVRTLPIGTLGIGREQALFRDTKAELVIVRNPTRVVEVWSTRNATLVRKLSIEGEHPLALNCASLSSTERELIATTEPGELVSVSLENGQMQHTPVLAKGPTHCMVTAASGYVLVLTANEVIKASYPEISNVTRVRFHGAPRSPDSEESSVSPNGAYISANGAYVASMRDDNKLDVVDVASMKMNQLTLPDSSCWSLPSFDPTSRYLGFGASVYQVGTWKSLVHYEKPGKAP